MFFPSLVQTALYRRAMVVYVAQVLLASGLMVFAYEVTVLPLLAEKASTTTSLRVVSVVLVVAHPMFPLLTHLRGTGWPLIAASVALLFTIFACCDSVSDACGRNSDTPGALPPGALP